MKTVLLFIWRPIKKLLHLIGRINTFIILSLFYFVILAPAKIWLAVKKVFGGRRTDQTSFWIKREGLADPKSAKMQF